MSVVELPGTTLLATVAAALLLFVSGGVIYRLPGADEEISCIKFLSGRK